MKPDKPAMEDVTRRRLLLGGAVLIGATLAPRDAAAKDENEISPTEDLMREHGLLRRILIVYAEAARRLEASATLPIEQLADAAHLVRAFVEDYHERDEEEQLFPRMREAGRLVPLIDVLKMQHDVGRVLTDQIRRLAIVGQLTSSTSRRALAEILRKFIHMYEAHAVREDTVLFPAFLRTVTPRELHKVGELFEQREQSLSTGDFDKVVAAVARIEDAFALSDLASYTPHV